MQECVRALCYAAVARRHGSRALLLCGAAECTLTAVASWASTLLDRRAHNRRAEGADPFHSWTPSRLISVCNSFCGAVHSAVTGALRSFVRRFTTSRLWRFLFLSSSKSSRVPPPAKQNQFLPEQAEDRQQLAGYKFAYLYFRAAFQETTGERDLMLTTAASRSSVAEGAAATAAAAAAAAARTAAAQARIATAQARIAAAEARAAEAQAARLAAEQASAAEGKEQIARKAAGSATVEAASAEATATGTEAKEQRPAKTPRFAAVVAEACSADGAEAAAVAAAAQKKEDDGSSQPPQQETGGASASPALTPLGASGAKRSSRGAWWRRGSVSGSGGWLQVPSCFFGTAENVVASGRS